MQVEGIIMANHRMNDEYDLILNSNGSINIVGSRFEASG
jgi:hypothetical protein